MLIRRTEKEHNILITVVKLFVTEYMQPNRLESVL